MKRHIFVFVGLMSAVLWISTEIWARGGRGGGGFGGGAGVGGGGGGMGAGAGRGGGLGGIGGGRPGGYGGGGYAGAVSRTPTMSRPAAMPNVNRPYGTGISVANRPNTSRPTFGTLPTPGPRLGAMNNRPSGTPLPGNIGTLPATRPGNISNRPGAGTLPGNIPNLSVGQPSANINLRPGSVRPSDAGLSSFIDVPGPGGVAAAFGNSRPNAKEVFAGGVAAAFLHDVPNNFQPHYDFGPSTATRPSGDTRPARPDGAGSIAQNKPGEGNRPTRPGENGGDNPLRPGTGNRPDRPQVRPGKDGDGTQRKPSDWANNRPDRIPNRNEWSNWRNTSRDDIRNQSRDHPNMYHLWFARNWWQVHHEDDPYYPGFYYWDSAQWPAVTKWVDSGWSQPISYNYGDNVYYQNDQVYYGELPVATAADYIEQAEAIATNLPATKPAEKDWMPLGVFAITADGKPTGADPTMYLQLAVSKQGMINGTFQNTATDDVQQISGMVDKQSQRAAWRLVGKTRPIMETGFVNLTEDTAPALVHFADGSTQQWLLVRLDKPKGEEASKTK